MRNILEVFAESFDFLVFYELIVYGTDSTKNTAFSVQSLGSIIGEFPQILNSCAPTTNKTKFATVLQAFTDSIMTLVKMLVYFDTGSNMFMNKEWIFSGFYWMSSALNLVSFIAYVSFNT